MSPSWREALLSGAGQAAAALRALPELDALLERLLAAARRAWPDVSLEAEDFLHHLGAHVGREQAPARALAEVCVEDLFLAWACAAGNARALAHFQAQLEPVVKDALHTHPAERVEEALGVLRERLLVARPGERPRIGGYSGRGSLAGWVRVAAVRTALNLKDREREGVRLEAPEAEAPAAVPLAENLELRFLQEHYRADFQEALEEALAALEPAQRRLLRQHFLEGLSIDALGKVHGVHRSTAARWLVRLREGLLVDMRRRLMARLAVGEGELDSLLGVMRSQLEVSVGGLLRSGGE